VTRMWGGRFDGAMASLMEKFNASLPFDRRMWEEDILGSIAYARALQRAGVITVQESQELERGLEQVLIEFREGRFDAAPEDEDIHTAVERRLRELVGAVAGKLHTGRSRNDQVATDLRLYVRRNLSERRKDVRGLQGAILSRAREHIDVLMPGYTHLQRAQPVRFSHWLLSHFWALQRDVERLDDLLRRVNVMPLGSGALAGNPLPIDRDALAAELGFDRVGENSMDSVRDRDFVLETLFWAATLAIHLSQLAEDLILWSTAEFGFVRVSDAYSTGSSLMPQKRNPDALELIRGKTGRVIGSLVSVAVMLKGLPSTYDKDLQEDKQPLFDVLDALGMTVPIATGVIETLTVNKERMRAALEESMLATDLADYLVRKGMPFREAHEVVGRAVALAERRGCSLSGLAAADWRSLSDQFGADVNNVFSWERSVEARSSKGGTARQAVERQIERAVEVLRG